MPRVKFHSCFSSPLLVDKENKQIPSSLKLAFIQSFLNRLKNKVSKVDLISSGVGYLITAVDLEDSVNFLNKELISFGEKEMRARMDTAAFTFDMQR